MYTKINKKYSLVLIDDDIVIRQAIKAVLSCFKKVTQTEISIFTSENGVEGLGLVFVTNPDIVIIDTTLPKYSGRELIDYLSSNQSFLSEEKRIIVLTENPQELELPSNFLVLNKKSKNFVEELLVSLSFFCNVHFFYENKNSFVKLKLGIVNRTIKLANSGNVITGYMPRLNIAGKLLFWILWLFTQLGASIYLSLVHLTTRKEEESNITQHKADLRKFRRRYYPALASLLASLIILLSQVGLFIAGGVVIFNTKVESLLALVEEQEVEIDLGNSSFDPNAVEYVDGSIKLKELRVTGYELPVISNQLSVEEKGDEKLETREGGQETEEEVVPTSEQGLLQPKEESIVQESPTAPTEALPGNNNEMESPVSSPSEVLGVEDNLQTNTNRYSTENPEVIISEEIEYTKLVSILEDSNTNSFQTSLETQNFASQQDIASQQGITSQQDILPLQSQITYQLSPDKENWYYHGLEGWEKTTNGYESSNPIQEINRYLQDYVLRAGGNKLFVKVFLHSDGSVQTSLKRLQVNREIDLVSDENVSLPEEKVEPKTIELKPTELVPTSYPVSYGEEAGDLRGGTKTEGELVSYPVSYGQETGDGNQKTTAIVNLPTPVILNASYANGNKVVIGYINNEGLRMKNERIRYVIPDEELGNYRVNIYYTNSTDISTNAMHKGELIGTTGIQKISVNGIDQYVFELLTPNSDGGHVTAELVYTGVIVGAQNLVSVLSHPVENSTFTVNETGDQVDVTPGDGICDRDAITPGSQCTLRAAIQESNALAGSDNLYFNIPITDPGYRDNDLADTPSSGDSLGGDDYWTIRPATALVSITGTIILDGATQTINQGDTNSSGPEIEINGVSLATTIDGLTFSSAASSSSVNSVVVRDFRYQILLSTTNNFTLTNSYIGVNVLGTGVGRSTQLRGLNTVTSTNLNIGTSTADGNIFGGFKNTTSAYAIYLDCGTAGIARVINIKGNKIGLGSDGVTNVGNNNGIYAINDCNITIGGDTAAERNYISNNIHSYYQGNAINFLPTAGSGIANLKIFNNFIGTDVSGDLAAGNGIAIYMTSGRNYLGPQNPIQIGAPGKGNLIVNNYYGVYIRSERDTRVENNSIGGKWYTILVDGTAAYNQTNLKIYNNDIGGSATGDPYFGKIFGGGTDYVGDITFIGASPVMKGNYVYEQYYHYYYIENGVTEAVRLYANTWNTPPSYSQPIIGGQNAFSGSLCEGLEKNCFVTSVPTVAIMGDDSVAYNEATIYEDNTFVNSAIPYRQTWVGTFELMSGTVRRTDLPDNTFRALFPENTKVLYWDPDEYYGVFWGQQSGSYAFNEVACTVPAYCPESGSSSGVLGKTMVSIHIDSIPYYNDENSAMRFVEYEIDADGNRTDYGLFKFDEPHFVSEEFSFDGSSLTEPPSSDLGDVWSQNTSGTRDPVTGSYTSLELMEVQFVDANPVLQDDGSYVITVDSTTDEDNVSLSGYDDGGGAYSGGGYNGVNGLSNGKTSLREAIIVANNHAGPDKIHFNIPTSDTGYRDYNDPDTASSGDGTDGDDYWTIRPGGLLPTITGSTIINGISQTTNQGDTNNAGPEVEINGQNAGAINGITFGATATNSSINAMVVNNYGGTPTTNGVSVAGDNFTITRSYLGTDIRNEQSADNGVGIYISLADNVVIGNTTDDGNVISGNNDIGAWFNCGETGTGKHITMRGNRIGIDFDGTRRLSNGDPYSGVGAGVRVDNECILLVGGDSPNHRNYFAGDITGLIILTSENLFSDVQVYNNFFGTGLTGTEDFTTPTNSSHIAISKTYSEDPQNTITIGDLGKSNLFRFNGSVHITNPGPMKFQYNTYASDGGVYFFGRDNASSAHDIDIINNFIGRDIDEDPYFGLAIHDAPSSSDGIYLENYTNVEIKGNIIKDRDAGVYVFARIDPTRRDTPLLANIGGTPVVGGTNAYTNSLCNGIESNCIYDNEYGIYSEDTVPLNEITLYQDNNFGSGNTNSQGRSTNIIQTWRGALELFSGVHRRTDLADETLEIELEVVPSIYYPDMLGHNYSVDCLSAPDCPASGDTIGVNGKTVVIGPTYPGWGFEYYPFQSFFTYDFYEYTIDNDGNKTEYSTTNHPEKFELPHFASLPFSFNGKVDTYESYLLPDDRGEPWTNNNSATRDVPTQDFALFQTMEVEYVDANPIMQGDGSFVITVDSTTDEDNVSLAGFDDGDGSYSGGGVNGVNGLPNGKTSLREAMIVANNFGQPVTINFNIPTSDPGWNTVGYPNTFVIKPLANLPTITASNITLEGESQTQFSGDSNLEQTEYSAEYGADDYTTGPEIILAGSTGVTRLIEFLGQEIKIDRVGFYNQNNQVTSGGLRPVQFGSSATKTEITNCTFDSNGNGNIGTYQITSPELTLRSNVFKNTAPNSPGDRDALEGKASRGWIEDNIIISNDAAGIGLYNSSSLGTLYIRNNYIIDNGTIGSGAEGRNGIVIACNNPLKISIEGNFVSQNALDGITILRDCQGVTMKANKIFANGGENIDIADLTFGGGVPDLPNLLGDGINENDSGDSDSGPNNLQNSPVISKVEYVGSGQYKVSGDLSGNSSESPFNIEICESYENTLNQGGCIRTLGTGIAASPWATTVTIVGDDGTQSRIFSALSTNSNGSTSEFSSNYKGFETLKYDITLVYPINGTSISDKTPQLDWNPAQKDGIVTPDINQYDIYVDGTYFATVGGNVTNYELANELSLGDHTWQVIAYRKLNSGSLVEISRSDTEDFKVVKVVYTFTPIYPVDIIIDDTTPKFEWTQPLESSGTTSYELVIINLDDEGNEETTIRKNIIGRENPFYQLIDDELLSPGQYEWYIIAYKTTAGGEKVEISRTERADFEILSPKPVPVSYGVGSPEEKIEETGILSEDETKLEALLPLGIAGLMAGLTALFTALGFVPTMGGGAFPILFGVLFGKKRKYWGIIYDIKEEKAIPLATVKLFKGNIFVKQTLSDMKGRYGLQVEEEGEYTLEVKAGGYKDESRAIHIGVGKEVVEDIGLTRKYGIVAENKPPLAENISLELKYHKKEVMDFVKWIFLLLMILGLIYTLEITSKYPTLINKLIIVAYLFLIALNLVLITRNYLNQKARGKVVDLNSGRGIGGVSVRFYLNNELIDIALTNKNGDIKVILEEGEYLVLAGKREYEQIDSLKKITVDRAGHLGENIRMKRISEYPQEHMHGSLATPFGE